MTGKTAPDLLQLEALPQLVSTAGSEIVKAACKEESFQKIFLDLVHLVWEERQVPREWVNVSQIPIPKKRRPQGL